MSCVCVWGDAFLGATSLPGAAHVPSPPVQFAVSWGPSGGSRVLPPAHICPAPSECHSLHSYRCSVFGVSLSSYLSLLPPCFVGLRATCSGCREASFCEKWHPSARGAPVSEGHRRTSRPQEREFSPHHLSAPLGPRQVGCCSPFAGVRCWPCRPLLGCVHQPPGLRCVQRLDM